jgi:phage shock protein A
MGDPHDPLGPERSVPPANAAGDARPNSDNLSSDAPAHPSRLLSSGRLSRLDEEIEALRRSPTPTQTGQVASDPQTERVASRDRASSFLDGVAFMGIFSRTRDIIAANFNDMLDKADDPTKMIRMIILEMEETLVEVRASAARTIADQKEMHRHCVKLDRLQADWSEKAQLALSKDREDLARAALVEKKKAGDILKGKPVTPTETTTEPAPTPAPAPTTASSRTAPPLRSPVTSLSARIASQVPPFQSIRS